MNNLNIALIVAIITFWFNDTIAQKTFYKMPNGKIYNESYFNSIHAGLLKSGNVKVEFVEKSNTTDSIIKDVKLSFIDKSKVMNSYDPYAKHKKNIGKIFDFTNFKNRERKNFNKNYLKGKPTFINFWFTRCTPCIEEIPNLNKIQSTFMQSVNFVAITFDTDAQVKKFLEKNAINFEHIVDARKALDDLEIEAYPMNILLDKNGRIVDVYGEISYDEQEIILKLKKLL